MLILKEILWTTRIAIVKRVEIWFWVSLSLFSRRLGIIIQFLQYYNRKQGLKQKYVYYKEHSILCKISNVSDDCSTHLCIWQTSPYHDHFSLQPLQVPWWLCFQSFLHDCKHVLYGNSCEKSSCWVWDVRNCTRMQSD